MPSAMLDALIAAIEKLTAWVGRKVSWLSALLVVVFCVDVTFRYLFQKSSPWVMELEWHLYSLLFLFGAAYTLQRDRHVRVDLFYSRFSAPDKALTNLIGTLFFLLPWCVMVIWASWPYALESWRDREGSPNPNGLPAWYLIKFAIIVGVGLLLLQGIAELLKALKTLRDPSTLEEKEEKPTTL